MSQSSANEHVSATSLAHRQATRARVAQATHGVSRDAMSEWLAEHGYDAKDVAAARIDFSRVLTDRFPAFLTVRLFNRDEKGELYVSGNTVGEGHEEGQTVSTYTTQVPLRSWPALSSLDEE